MKFFLLLISALCYGTIASAQDYSDAPASYGNATHSIVNSLYIGSIAPDNDGIALATSNANGDNVQGINDENTFASFPALNVSTTTYTITSIPVFNNTGSSARLTAWIDFNRNGVFDTNEGVQSAALASSASATTISLTWSNIGGTGPAISPGKSFVRFRLTTNTGVTTATPSTATTNGEVEDYLLTIGTVSATTCSSTGQSITTFSFQNPTLISGTALAVGAVYRFPSVTTGVDALVRINSLVNATVTNIDNVTVGGNAIGDPAAFQPSVTYPTTNPIPTDPYAEFQISFVAAGTTTSYVQFTTVSATGVDIDGDGTSTLREFQEFPNLPSYTLNGTTNINVTNNGNFKRFTPNSNANLDGISIASVTNAATGLFNNVSTFTYRVGATTIASNSALPRYYSLDFQCVPYVNPVTTPVNINDYGDAPTTYGTLSGSSGASHVYTNNLKLGAEGGDTEPNGFNDGVDDNGLAQDDDVQGTVASTLVSGVVNGGDEDAVDFPKALYTNSPSYSIVVTASNTTGSSANLRAWLDFNRNGVFDSGEASNLTTVPTGANNQPYFVSWPTTLPTMTAGQSYVRVRLTTASLNTNEATGAKANGEVEDYAVTITSGNPPVLLTGTVFNDVNGITNSLLDGTGTNAGGTLYALLVNTSSTLVASSLVQADGSYIFNNIAAGTYTVRLSTSAGTVGSTAPAVLLPTGWVSTSEALSPAFTDGTVDGTLSVTVATTDLSGANFGIEQLPTPGSGTALAANAGGSSAVTVPPTAFTSTTPSTDTAPGSVTAIRLTVFPSNVTSLTINGTTYTSLPTGGISISTDANGVPAVPILMDPTNDNSPVSFSYVAVDNATKESATTGTAVISFPPTILVSGTVWNDADGNLALNGSETGTNAGGPLYVNLVNASNAVTASTTVSAAGSYTLTGVPASTTGLKLVLTNTASSTAPGGLPTGWVNTGENVGSGNTATQSAALGLIELTTSTSAIAGQNFGIEQLPTPGSGTGTVVNSGGTNAVTVPPTAFTSTTPSTDTAPGSVTAIRLTVFPSNVTSLTVNTTAYTSLPSGGIVIPTTTAGVPTVTILADPTNDSSPVNFTFVAVDNAGKESTTTGTAVITSTLVTTLSGTVWNDADGNLALNGSETGTNTGTTLYVNLVNGANTLVASTTVAASGTYSLTGVPTNVSGYRLVLSTSSTATTPGPLPTGWVNTGETVGSGNTATQSTTLGQIELTTTTIAVTAQNFGIEQLPSSGSGSATVVNNGGTSAVTVPASAFTSTTSSTDTAPGSVTAIRLTAFPSNVTSLTIDGSVYTSLPAGGIVLATNTSGSPTGTVLVDPTNDASPVSFTFVAVDNAGKESTNLGTATINSTLVTSISGSVWNDADGSLTLNGSETGTNAGGPLYVNLVNASNTVVASTSVGSAGSYSLLGVPTNVSGYKLVLTNSATSTTPGPLPTGWVNTGESVGAGNSATQSAALGQIEIAIGTSAAVAQNFGIEQLPTPGSGSATVINTGGTNPVTVPASAFTSTISSTDTAPGSVTAIRLTAFPSNTTSLSINGSVYTSLPTGGILLATDASGNPTVTILVDPTNDGASVVFNFVSVDNAGKESTTTGTAVINSTLVTSVSGTVWNDADGNLALNGSETGTNTGTTLYVNLVNASNTVVASTTVGSAGSYALTGVPANMSGYRLVLTNSATSTTPGPLPTGWVNTGESVGAGNSATQTAILGQIELSLGATAAIAQNFGIEQLPTAGSGANTVTNVGGTTPVSVPANTFTNASLSTDTAPGSVTAIRLTAFPSNTSSLTVNGSVYTSLPTGGILLATDASGNPTVAILVDPTNDGANVVFNFVAVDNAGKESLNTGSATISSALITSISGSVWNDADGNLALNGSEAGTNTGGTLYVNLVNASNTVVASTSVGSAGSYALTGVPTNVSGYKLVLTNSATSTTPGPLPTGWVNTGESVGAGNSATQSAALGQIEIAIGTSAAVAQNFGIEQLPIPGSGSATVINTGATNPVTVPASAFTSTTPSADTAPGSVTAIRITAFPSNVTSLTVDGTVYTSLPVGGIVLATNSSGAPTGTILADPTNDSSPVNFTFVAVDNAGKESTTTGTAVITSTLVTTLSGTVWNDADGNLALNGSETGTNTGTTLYVNLINAANTLVASTTVAATGVYSLTGVPTSVSGYRLVLSTSSTATTPGPLPTGWVNTGESAGPSNTATQSAVLGQIEITIGTTSVTAQNFGIEQLPSAGNGSNTVTNAGGSSPVTVPANTFTNGSLSTDTAPGSVTAIRITGIPSNTTSLTINGSVYTAGTFPGAGVIVPTDANGNPSVPVLVDPTNDASPVVIIFVSIDNASKESINFGTATISSNLVTGIFGSVWNDADGSLSLNGSETGTNTGTTLYVNVVDGAGSLVASTTVATDGTYGLTNLPTNVSGYKLVLSTSATATTPGPLPTGWVNTGESVGAGNSATQSAILGQIEITIGTSAVTAQNFGIEQLPSAGNGSNTVINAGSTSPVTVPANTFTNGSLSTDTAPGSVTAIRITSFPGNVTSLTVNGSVYTAGTFPGAGVIVPTDGNGNPSVPVLVDPTNDANSVAILFVSIDNAGKESANFGTAVINSTLVTSISGTVWNDADGSLSLNGSENGTNTGTTLYVNLLDASNTLVASTSVAADGSYTLTGLPTNVSGYRLVLSTSATATTPGPLPTGWVNTGESVGAGNSATQSAILGQIEITIGTTSITAQNFGIEQLPSAGNGSNTVTNAGGSSPVTVPANTFTNGSLSTDTAPGSVTAIRITSFPGNVTSLTVNGSVYTAGTFPGAGVIVQTDGNGNPTPVILVDPTNDANPVVIVFVAVDNAGKESTNIGTAIINSTLVTSISGTIWNDADGSLSLNGSEMGTNTGGPLFVNLLDAGNTLVASTTVATDGSYALVGVPTNVSGYKLVLSTSATATTPGPLPTGWVNTGESVDPSNSATQSAVLGQIEITIGTTSVTAQNFGIEQLPSAGNGSNAVTNAGGTSPVTVPANTFTNGSLSTDTAPGSVTAIRITSFPGNVTSLTINGSVYTAGTFPGAGVTVPTDTIGNPSVPVLVDPTNDANPVVILFVVIDNASKESTNTGTAIINSTLVTSISGTVWNDADGSLTLNGSETGTNTGGPLYVNIVDGAGTVVGSTTVATDGSYALVGVPTNVSGYRLVLSTSATAVTPGPLPTGWVNTGESVDPSNSATQSAVLGQIEITIGTTSVTAQNFGIEQLPAPGSGTAVAVNNGGAFGVTVPATAFSSISPGTDTAPGSVTAIRLTGFPSNATSLTINGTVYTAGTFPGGGVAIPTTSTGEPTVPILVNPTNDAANVVFTYVAVDNAGKQSTTTGTATLLARPDLTPIIYARPTSVYATTPVTVVVDVVELVGVATSGTVTVRVTRDSRVNLTYDPSATRINNRAVQNSVWTINNSSPGYYTLTTTQPIAAGDKLSFGFTGTLTTGATTGVVTLSAVILGTSGSEVRVNNNVDADKIDYFQQ
ncbi:beta strand repeat-containing protein [Spirosoma validum]|uniref:GEVED domain-containing protein n=1 Tax=Spirosoma validum TaxID=2771355 RepID=A0A927B067_9BACT|nr:GEVED domain-containing protein [Spirosoma validum]MBD2752971.1 hypothetical protein [Spirosoma validum]